MSNDYFDILCLEKRRVVGSCATWRLRLRSVKTYLRMGNRNSSSVGVWELKTCTRCASQPDIRLGEIRNLEIK